MSEILTVRRWSRFGADRLVVTSDIGGQVGWIDLLSGEVVVKRPVLEDNLRRAAQEYLRADVPELFLPVPRRPRHAFDALEAMPSRVPVRAPDGSVGSRLAQLACEGWLVLDDVPVSRQGDLLDHLLIGPGGVFAIRVHLHQGCDVRLSRNRIEVDGRSTNYLRDARLESGRVQQMLHAAVDLVVEVRAVIVLGATSAVSRMPDAALVVVPADVPAVFRRQPSILAATKVEALRAAAGRRATWTS
jgi:hypothetical protein